MTRLTRWLRKRRIARLEVQLAHYREFASSYEAVFHSLNNFTSTELNILCASRAKVTETAKLLEQLKKEQAGTTQKGAGMTEPNKVDGNFELYDERTGKSLAVKVSGSHAGINIAVAGYGECSAQDGCGAPIFLEFYGGRLALHVWGDINQEDPTHTLDLKGALESLRKENL